MHRVPAEKYGEGMEITPVSSGVGANVADVDLRSLTTEDHAQIEAAWADYGVLFFRNQTLTPEEHLAFSERFAPADVNKFFGTVEGHPAIAEVRKDPGQTKNIGGGWHADHTYDLAPARGSILLARETPTTGGDTMFADAAAAYDALSPAMQQMLEGLKAMHTNVDVFGPSATEAREMGDRFGNAEQATNTVVHPVVIRHPQSGRKVLFVNPGFTRHFDGWTKAESRPLLKQLYAHIGSPVFTTRFRWEPGSIAMWDNRRAWHWALNDYDGQRRVMHRVTIQGEELAAA
jgi:taurine dioxygenase